MKKAKYQKKIPKLNILKQLFSQVPLLYELNSTTKFISSGWKTTKEFIKNGSWK